MRRQQVGNPKLLGAHPNSQFLRSMLKYQRTDMLNTMLDLYLNGRFFQQDSVSRESWMEDPRPLAKLLIEDRQWYDSHFLGLSKMLTSVLRHDNDDQICRLRRNHFQGNVVRIDFLQSEVMEINCPILCPSTLWALAHCVKKKRFTFGTVIGVDCLRGED